MVDCERQCQRIRSQKSCSLPPYLLLFSLLPQIQSSSFMSSSVAGHPWQPSLMSHFPFQWITQFFPFLTSFSPNLLRFFESHHEQALSAYLQDIPARKPGWLPADFLIFHSSPRSSPQFFFHSIAVEHPWQSFLLPHLLSLMNPVRIPPNLSPPTCCFVPGSSPQQASPVLQRVSLPKASEWLEGMLHLYCCSWDPPTPQSHPQSYNRKSTEVSLSYLTYSQPCKNIFSPNPHFPNSFYYSSLQHQ